MGALLAFVGLLSGAEPFTFVHSPDSEFYFSLGAFGSEVTDRSPDPYYFWTKLGLNLPVLALSELTDAWTAHHIWRLLLILMVLGSSFALARPRASRIGASASALFVTLNTAIMGHIGDPYFAGTAIALLCVAIALAHRILLDDGGIPTALFFGLCGAWMLMTNPYVVLICVGAVAGLGATRLPELARLGILRLELLALGLLAGFAIGYAGFVAWGARVYPDLDWLPQVKGFVLTAQVDVFAEEGWAWLASETSLLVPLAAALVALGVKVQSRGKPAPGVLDGALGLVLVPGFLAIAYKLISGSAVLEAGYYNVLLWPPALMGIVMITTAVSTGTGRTAASWVMLALTSAAWLAAGHITVSAIPAIMAAITIGTCALVIFAIRDWPVLEATAIVVVLGALGVLFQVDQNARPPRSNGLIAERVPYSNAYRASGVADELRRDLAFQSWLVASTRADDQIVLWASGPTSMAAMQLWGPNGIFEDEAGNLRHWYYDEPAPKAGQAVVTLASSAVRSSEMGQRLMRAASLSEPRCRDFSLDRDTADVARACVYHPRG